MIGWLVGSGDRARGSKAWMPALDGVRAASILLVLAAHTLPLGPKSLSLNAAAGKMGMSLFFCLSGFLITKFLMEGQPLGVFALRRVSRIVPAAALYILVLFAFFGLPEVALWTNLLFVSNYVHAGLSGGPVGHFWSLCVEMHFYLAICLAVAIAGRRALYAIPVAALAVTLIRVDAGAYVNIKTHLRVDEILSGGCMALVVGHRAALERLFAFVRSYAAVLLPVVGALWFASSHELGGPLNYLRPYFAAMLVFVLAFGEIGWIVRLLSTRVLGYIAETSYALYIWHPLMVFGFMNQGTTWERYLLKRPVSFLLTWLAAHLSTFGVEKPISRWIRGKERVIFAERRTA